LTLLTSNKLGVKVTCIHREKVEIHKVHSPRKLCHSKQMTTDAYMHNARVWNTNQCCSETKYYLHHYAQQFN